MAGKHYFLEVEFKDFSQIQEISSANNYALIILNCESVRVCCKKGYDLNEKYFN